MTIGVGFLLFSTDSKNSKIFVVRELKDKPEIYKRKGMLSFPLETFKKSDGGFDGTLDRLIVEEIGVPRNMVLVDRIVPENFYLIPGRSDIITVYGYGFFRGNPAAHLFPSDDDIAFAGWYTCEELLNYPLTRVETAPILQHFLKNYAREFLG